MRNLRSHDNAVLAKGPSIPRREIADFEQIVSTPFKLVSHLGLVNLFNELTAALNERKHVAQDFMAILVEQTDAWCEERSRLQGSFNFENQPRTVFHMELEVVHVTRRINLSVDQRGQRDRHSFVSGWV